MNPRRLYFHPTDTVIIGGNRFIDVPVVLQYDATPMIEIVRDAGLVKGPRKHTTQFHIFGADGQSLGRVKGSRLFPTEAGKASGVEMRHDVGVTACELNGRTLFEVRRPKAAAISVTAELFTPDGRFVRCNDGCSLHEYVDGDGMTVGRVRLEGNTFRHFAIAVHVKSNGEIHLGVGRAAAEDSR